MTLPNLRLAIVKLRLQWAGLTLMNGCEMAFRIRFDADRRPAVTLGPPGAELRCYVPEGAPWVQRHYAGRAEGVVEIDGREWGFYWSQPASLDVTLHGGEIEVGQALAFVRAVADRLAGADARYALLIAGQRFHGVVKLPGREGAPQRRPTAGA